MFHFFRTGSAPRGSLLLAGAVAIAVGLAGCGSANSQSSSHGDSKYDGAELAKTLTLPDVTFTDTSNQPYNLPAKSQGKLTLYFFGYTSCPDVCPTTMADLNTALTKLDPAQRDRVQVVFVTTDPDVDTLPVLRTWLDRFNPSFIGLRTSEKEMQDTAAKLGVVAELPTEDEHGGHEVVHGAQVIAFSPSDGQAHLVWLADTKPDEYAHDIRLLLA